MEFLSSESSASLSSLLKTSNLERDKSASFEQISNLHKVVVRQSLHQMVSPLNAIQGYLELFDASGDVEPNAKQQYYKKQIETGLNELHNILNHIHSLYEGQQSMQTEVERMNSSALPLVNQPDAGPLQDGDTVKTHIPSPTKNQLSHKPTLAQAKTSEQLLDVDINWIIRDAVDKYRECENCIRFTLANTHTHIEADVFLLRVVFHELFSLCSSLYQSHGITSELSTNYEEGRVVVCCQLSKSIGLGDWSNDASLPLKQYHRWLDLAKSIDIQTASTNNQFVMYFPAAYGKQRVK